MSEVRKTNMKGYERKETYTRLVFSGNLSRSYFHSDGGDREQWHECLDLPRHSFRARMEPDHQRCPAPPRSEQSDVPVCSGFKADVFSHGVATGGRRTVSAWVFP